MNTFVKKISLILFCSTAASIAYAKTISFTDNQMIPISLSSTNINRIAVNNDQITHVICPSGFCTSKNNGNDQSGAAYVQLLTENPFTLFVSTQNGHHVALSVKPTQTAGKTLVLNPLSSNLKAQTWETESSYRALLITLIRDMMNGTTPDGYGFTTINHTETLKIFGGSGSMQMQAVWSGNYLVGTAYLFKNLTDKALTLPESAFYHTGVRLVATTDQKISAGSTEMVYEIESRN